MCTLQGGAFSQFRPGSVGRGGIVEEEESDRPKGAAHVLHRPPSENAPRSNFHVEAVQEAAAKYLRQGREVRGG